MIKLDYPITDPINTVIVTSSNNGLILTKFIDIETVSGSTEYEVAHEVYEAKGDFWSNEPDFECVKNFLWGLLDALGIYTSKHYKKTLNIEVEDQED